jgi:hypothetical protein
MARLFIRLAVWSLRVAGRFAEANDKAALRSLQPLLAYLLMSPAERSRAMSRS